MILLFRIISDEDPEFFRDLVIDGSDTFLDFHHSIQENLGFDPSQLASFFITSEMWEKQLEITLIDMMQEQGMETHTMEDVTIEKYVSELNQRLIYVFDFFSERAFFMELIEKSDQSSSKKTPFMANARGNPPPQLALDLLTEEPDEIEKDPGGFMDNDLDPYGDMGDQRLEDIDPDQIDGENPEDF